MAISETARIQARGVISPYEAASGYDLQVGADGILWLPRTAPGGSL